VGSSYASRAAGTRFALHHEAVDSAGSRGIVRCENGTPGGIRTPDPLLRSCGVRKSKRLIVRCLRAKAILKPVLSWATWATIPSESGKPPTLISQMFFHTFRARYNGRRPKPSGSHPVAPGSDWSGCGCVKRDPEVIGVSPENVSGQSPPSDHRPQRAA